MKMIVIEIGRAIPKVTAEKSFKCLSFMLLLEQQVDGDQQILNKLMLERKLKERRNKSQHHTYIQLCSQCDITYTNFVMNMA